MFTEIRLITKRGNIVQEPNPDWSSKSRIHCACCLEIGFGDKIIWLKGNTIRLSSLIDFYNKLAQSVTNPDNDFHKYEFYHNDGNIAFEWARIGSTTFKFTVKIRHFSDSKILIDKYYWSGHLYDYRHAFFLYIMSILTQRTNEAVCIAIGETFSEKQEQNNYEFKIGQKIKIKAGGNVKTIREGYIINRFFHHREKRSMYQILENGKKLKKRCYASDFEIQ
ncbi:hypothetical protein IC235_12255 [Hymenobacter sp. BT664]|uniref:Uncharacterized protein n=1 Tax=Hymenobacter montanus TaxID=2771359 RepID=A0A927BEL9_9BACT|nr:hypothetical protein [Hymenobacter montanus]MBD2768659.1 hypothetical protein [Hymenobacter montanus]